MGFFSSLDIEEYDRQYTDRQLFSRIADYFRPHALRMALIAFFLFLVAIAWAISPLLVSAVIDTLGEEITDQQILIVSGAVMLSGGFVWFSNWILRRMIGRTVGEVVLAVRVDAFDASVSHDLSFYDKFSSGRVVSRITSDTREFGQMITLITDIFSQVGQALILGIALAFVELKFMGYLLTLVPVIFLVSVGFRHWARIVTRKGFRAMANVNAAIKETVSGIAVAKNFRQEETIFSEFDEANQSSFKVNMERGFVLALIFPTLNTIHGIGVAILLYVGGLEVAMGVVTIGAWFLFLQSLDRLWFPILNLSAFWAQLQSGLSAAERSFALVDAESNLTQTAADPVSSLKGEIRFNDLSFQYSDKEQILKNFNLHIKAGEDIALVGHTGAGKSSIAKLVARFYEFQEGELTIDGKDIRTFDLGDYRSQLGIVSQSPFLFSGSVADNIRYARPDATDDHILSLANKIADGSWLETLPQGIETKVGERGGSLSMGQRQLVSLLRVLVQEPAVFILDEATASIDPFTEWQIQQTLQLILKNATSILIAHRLSTVKAADRIIVLKDGKIIEEGHHDGLMTADGHYANLYNTYFRHQSLDYIEEVHKLAEGD